MMPTDDQYFVIPTYRLRDVGETVRLYDEHFRRNRALEAAERAERPERKEGLRLFAANLQKSFYGFEPDFFQQNLLRIVDDVVTVIKGSIELWPTLVEICYFEKARRGLPRVKVANPRAS